MTAPKDGDFARHIDELSARARSSQALVAEEDKPIEPPASKVSQWLDAGTPELTQEEEKELLDELAQSTAETEGIEPISDEEFERQALEVGGSDNDPATPE